ARGPGARPPGDRRAPAPGRPPPPEPPVREPARERRAGRVHAACEYHACTCAGDRIRSVADGEQTRRGAGSEGHCGSAEAIPDPHLARRRIRHRGGEQPGARNTRPVGRDPSLIRRIGEEASERGAERDAEIRPRLPLHREKPSLAARGGGRGAAPGPKPPRPPRAGRGVEPLLQRFLEHRRRPRDGALAHARPSTTAALAPAKPDDVDSATRTSHRRASPCTRSRPAHSGSICRSPAVGGTRPRAMTSAHSTASQAPAAPSVWPIAPLIEFTGTAYAPNSRSNARASMASLNGVPVPCAETNSTAEGGTAAPASAPPTPRTTPPPSR